LSAKAKLKVPAEQAADRLSKRFLHEGHGFSRAKQTELIRALKPLKYVFKLALQRTSAVEAGMFK
jgi:hypothetical protein